MGKVLRDFDIREPLHRWLQLEHAHDPTTKIIHELKLPRPSARADVAVVNGELAGFEIKSDADSLARLPRQIVSFNNVFDRICLVTTPRHKKSIGKKIPQWWGIIIAKDKGDQISFVSARQSRLNPSPGVIPLLYTLHIPELEFVLRFASGSPCSNLKKSELVRMASELKPEIIREAARVVLKKRHSS
jgi:hypothetical protein